MKIERILITGVEGFIGRHLKNELLENGYDVLWVGKETNAPIEDRKSLLSLHRTRATLERLNPDAIIHLAAKSSVADSFLDPLRTIDYNLGLTRNLIDAISKDRPQTKMFYFSSSAVYARSFNPLREVDHMGPDSPYGLSKYIGELAVRKLPKFLIIRPFFVFGPGKRTDAIGSWCEELWRARELGTHSIQLGNLDRVRDLIPIKSFITTFTSILHSDLEGTEINIGSGQGTNLRDIFATLRKKIFPDIEMDTNHFTKERLIDRDFVVADISKLKSLDIKAPRHLTIDDLEQVIEFAKKIK